MDGISTYFLTQGFLGIAVLILGGVVAYQQKRIDKRDEKIQQLNDLILANAEKYAERLLELNKNNIEVLQGNSQSNELLAAKIEAGRGKR